MKYRTRTRWHPSSRSDSPKIKGFAVARLADASAPQQLKFG